MADTVGCNRRKGRQMIFGRWGTFARFVMLTTGIGLATSLTWSLFTLAIGGWDRSGDDVTTFSLIAAIGAGLGLVMGFPSYWVVRLFVRWMTSRAGTVLFFFLLAVASVMVEVVVVVIVAGGDVGEIASFFVIRGAGDLMGLPGIALSAGVFAAVCAPLVLRPMPDSLREADSPRPAGSGVAGCGAAGADEN
ncbi:MAG: hypothetical protein ACTH44_14935 [Brevibacterium aurantiacum]|nr:hypothetical protein [Brevibacterium aurantiacum]AZL06805.1 hypothetical protein CXR24_15385 [Brevibacterium aurantiacum]RCS92971.1 hypothetical protein CIK63_01725 [Brevibacterium aurantiacum]